jgi:hypothetical protein
MSRRLSTAARASCSAGEQFSFRFSRLSGADLIGKRNWFTNSAFLRFMRYALGTMEASTPRPIATSNGETRSHAGIKRSWFRTRLSGALIGACGFGLELDRAIGYYKHPRPDDSLASHFLLGFIFLAIAVQNSIFLISQMRDLQDITRK